MTSDDATLTNTADTTYSFTMPESDVEIDIEYAQYFEVKSFIDLTGGNRGARLTSLNVGDKLKAGEQKIQVSFTLSSFNTPEFITMQNALSINGVIYGLTAVDCSDLANSIFEATVDVNSDLVIYLTSPSQENTELGFTVSYEANPNVDIVGFTNGGKYVRIGFYVIPKLGYLVNKVSIQAEGGEEVELSTFFGMYTTPVAGNSEIYIDLVTSSVQNINYVNTDKITNINSLPTQATAGANVSFTAQVEDGYYVSNVSFSSSDAEGQIDDIDSNEIEFTMPNAELTITFEISQNSTLSYTGDEHVLGVTFFSDYFRTTPVTTYNSSMNIFIEVDVEEGYVVSEITAVNDTTGKNVYVMNIDGYYLQQPDNGGITLTITTTESILVTLAGGENVNVFFEDESTSAYFAPYSEIEFYFELASGYVIDEITCDDETALEFDYEYTTAYGILGENSCTITVNVKEAEMVTVMLDQLPESVAECWFGGNTSGAEIYEPGIYENFYAGEMLTGYAYGEGEYEIWIFAGMFEADITEDLSWDGFELSPDLGNEFIISVVEKVNEEINENEPINVTIINNTDLNLIYMVNGEGPFTELPELYYEDVLLIGSNDIQANQELIITAEDDFGTLPSDIIKNGILIEREITITVDVRTVEYVSLKVINNSTVYTDDKDSETGIGNYCRIESTEEYVFGGEYQIQKGDRVRVVSYKNVTCKVTINGELVYEGTMSPAKTFDVTGDVVIEIFDAQ